MRVINLNTSRERLAVYAVMILTVVIFSIYTVDYLYFEKVPALLFFGLAFIFLMVFSEKILCLFPICPHCHGFGVFPFDQLTRLQKIKNNVLLGFSAQYKSGIPCTQCNGLGWINLYRLWMEGK